MHNNLCHPLVYKILRPVVKSRVRRKHLSWHFFAQWPPWVASHSALTASKANKTACICQPELLRKVLHWFLVGMIASAQASEQEVGTPLVQSTSVQHAAFRRSEHSENSSSVEQVLHADPAVIAAWHTALTVG